jgi:DNA processing protein
MEKVLPFTVAELACMKQYPEKLYYRGNLELLQRPKVSIVGTRRPNPYTRAMTYEISKNVIFTN